MGVTCSVAKGPAFSWHPVDNRSYRTIESHVAVRARAAGFKVLDYCKMKIAETSGGSLGDGYEATTIMFAALYYCLSRRDPDSGLPYAAFLGECALDFSLLVNGETVSLALHGRKRHDLN